MLLISFSVRNYRSITTAHKLRIDKSTVLIGPNNEGKSNILQALVTAMKALSEPMVMHSIGQKMLKLHLRFLHEIYDWNRDFPVHLQAQQPEGESVFNLEFALTPEEIEEFWKEVGSRLNGTLPIQLTLGKDTATFKVTKRGPGASTLSQKALPIAQFIEKRLDVEYIRAVRTAEDAQRVVEEMVARELKPLEQNPLFQDAMNKVGELQKPILEQISNSIKETLSVFVPAVKSVSVRISKEERYRALRRSCEIIVNDGTPTKLQYKGDGVKSLAALSLMRHSAESGARGKNLMVAIEEPESHLHPQAIHQLRVVLQELSEKQQVVITTHCPLLVDRRNVRNNIIVRNNTAAQAKYIHEIREVLGVRASDNLQHAEIVLLVEGEDDRVALQGLLKHASQSLAEAFADGTIVIDSLLGAGKLSYKIGLIRNAVCLHHCFLDADEAGKRAVNQATKDGLLSPDEFHLSTCNGMSESEIEDMYDPNPYRKAIESRYGISFDSPKFKNDKKWSDRMRDVFKQQGKLWNETVGKQVKEEIAGIVAANPGQSLLQQKRGAFDALVTALEQKLKELK
jgi:energy-coupling factor transporter ATP-binding protein EcfA2